MFNNYAKKHSRMFVQFLKNILRSKNRKVFEKYLKLKT